VILILSGRLGRAWFLEYTRVSLIEFFSLVSTGQILALKGSPLLGMAMPSEEK
jgi:hypothetical protein